ncbi:ABC-type multidrug transport system ATPase subunit [Ancylomarina subtilis]|uniref:ABC-type multidrug transport system ATPase subunit n=1 Tax=Ancylomarina subtilis TaxID=1639035 RepID=A0A4Q7VJZ9_9BACT|nr:ATP-binding cassette domain-containing protein [Ancylomarina subtilis]RZT96523.1 ABC-type multidrug transport system ATPase subunit [Ancylomarina subtilis]
MSERILKALMQLFAIIAHPEGAGEKRRAMVVKYLYRQLDQDSAQEYLNLYNTYYQDTVDRNNRRSKRKQVISSRSVRVLRICSEMNKELVARQKIIILIQLLEFLMESDEITDGEKEFVETVADTFNLPIDGYIRLQDFMLSDFDKIKESDRLLTINNKKEHKGEGEHIYSEGISGEIKILRLVRIDMFVIRFQGLKELYMNGLALKPERVHILTQGSSVRNPRIEPIYFSDILSTFNREAINERVVFEAKDIEFRYKENDQGVHQHSFKEESGKMVGIMGSSGAGKTTLLNILNGSLSPQKGQVLINGHDIYSDKESIEGVIGHVSQDDLLIDSLTVFENLYFNAKLCFDKYSSFKLIRLVYKVLNDLGLYDARNLKVGNPLDKKISGGQRKRLNIALELIREPAVLFLDEPTSGLSSRDSSKIMDLLKNLALKGKLIFVVVHQPSSETFKMFDRLLFLDLGGYMIFNGNPLDAITYFKSETQQANRSGNECEVCGNIDADQIFNMVESEVLDEYGIPTQTRKVRPEQWDKRFKESDIAQKHIEDATELPPISFKVPKQFKQFSVFVKRDIISKLANKQYLLINFFETPLLAFILSYIIKFYNIDKANQLGYTFSNNSNIPVYLFMSVIVALFIGLTISAEEIIKDRKILKRERFLNLSPASYFLSKVVILFSVSAFQAFIFVIIGNSILEIKGMYFTYWLVLFSSWCFANMLGLVISDSFKTVINIYILIPFILIPQLILSGVIVKFDKINPNISHPNRIPWYGEIITARWAYEALAVEQFTANEYEKHFYLFDKIMSQADYKKNYWLPILKNKLSDCEKILRKGNVDEKYNSNLSLIYNELKAHSLPIEFKKLDLLDRNPTNMVLLKEVKMYLNDLNRHYIMLYNAANKKKDEELLALQSKFPDKESFVNMKKSYDNDRLTEFVKNSNDIERIVEYEDRLYQRIDPVFRDGGSSFLKAHFYAPRKKIFNREFDTYWVNITIIWLMTISLYFVLYFGLFKRFLNSLERRIVLKLT